ncbi:MAG TPA: hypothetical protein VEQ60_10750 [Longimicrobium sp.]|nr:hypothetical protein [Longimicrobium sp.]
MDPFGNNAFGVPGDPMENVLSLQTYGSVDADYLADTVGCSTNGCTTNGCTTKENTNGCVTNGCVISPEVSAT